MEKLHSYQGWTGRFHEWRDSLREWYGNCKDKPIKDTLIELVKNGIRADDAENGSPATQDYSHVYRLVEVLRDPKCVFFRQSFNDEGFCVRCHCFYCS